MLEVNETSDLNYNDTNILNNNLSEEEILKCKEIAFIILGKKKSRENFYCIKEK